MITKDQAIDILDKFDMFQGQRAGRELWNGKSHDVQEQDLRNFSHNVAQLKAYINANDATLDEWAEAYEESQKKWENHVNCLEMKIVMYERMLNSYALQYGTVTDQQKVIDKVKNEGVEETFKKFDILIKEHREGYLSDNYFYGEYEKLKKKYNIN